MSHTSEISSSPLVISTSSQYEMNTDARDSNTEYLRGVLPVELVILILEHVWNRDWNARFDLSSCSLVCKAWRPIAQRLRFTEVIIVDELRAASFLSAIQHNPSLGRATKILDLRIELRSPPSLSYDITSHCPNIYFLKVEFPFLPFSDPRCSFQTTDILHPRTFKELQALSIRVDRDPYRSYIASVKLNDLHYFLHQFSSLAHLRLQDVCALPNMKPSDSLPPPPSFNLYEFSWTDQTNPSVVQLDDYDREYAGAILCHFISNYGQNLISISSSISSDTMAMLPLNIFEVCPHLNELILPNATTIPKDMRLPYPHLPLVHLELGETRDHLLDPPEEVPPIQIVETIDWVMSLPNVRLITLNIYQWEYNPDYYLIKPWKERRGGRVELDCRVSPFQGLLGTIRYF
ncbi:hypothetical protein FRC02_005363, partial [Tulasnella sp. 418]